MVARRRTQESPTNSAALSLFELRRDLLRRSGELSARARGLKHKGADHSAARMAVESDRLLMIAQTMADNVKREKRS